MQPSVAMRGTCSGGVASLIAAAACVLVVCLACFHAVLQAPSGRAQLVLRLCAGWCGMGNQMFMHASGLGIARDHPDAAMCVLVSGSADQLHPGSVMALHVEHTIAPPLDACTRRAVGDLPWFALHVFGDALSAHLGVLDRFSPPHTVYEPFRIGSRRVTLIDSNLESFKYFQALPRPIYRLKQQDAAARWMAERGLTSAVHVRRGDKLLNGEPVAPLGFYEAALRVLGHGRVAVCTDDVPWVLRQRVFENASVSAADPGFDMALLAAATDTVIIGIGTFGWWGAYLSRARRKIFYPVQFTGGAAAGYRESDYIPYGAPGQGEWMSLGRGADI